MSGRSIEANVRAFESACLPPSREPNEFIRRHVEATSEQGFGGELPGDHVLSKARLEDIERKFPQPIEMAP